MERAMEAKQFHQEWGKRTGPSVGSGDCLICDKYVSRYDGQFIHNDGYLVCWGCGREKLGLKSMAIHLECLKRGWAYHDDG